MQTWNFNGFAFAASFGLCGAGFASPLSRGRPSSSPFPRFSV